MDNSIKSLTITGPAAEDAMKPRRGFGRSSSRKKRPDVQAEDEPELIENAKRIVFGRPPPIVPPIAPIQAQVKPQMVISAKPSVQQQPQQQIVQQIVQQQQHDGSKVILNPPKNQRVKLQPKVHPKVQSTIPSSPVNQTRKARRVHLINLTQRFTRAKRVRDDIQRVPMDTIRAYLIQKGVIQAKSKAPEKMLRSMYSDFMLLKDQAL